MATISELAHQARLLNAAAFDARFGPVALLSKPSAEEMQRVALKFQIAATTPITTPIQHLDELLLMLRGFRVLTAFFLKPLQVPQSFMFGRDPGCEGVIDHPSVSKQHASLSWSGVGWRIRDERSLNGTYVNAGPVPEGGGPLSDGDSVALGEAQLIFIQSRTLRSQLLALPLTGVP